MTADELTLQEAAESLEVHYMTVYRYVRLGLLPARRRGRSWIVEVDDLERFRTEREAEPASGTGSDPGSKRHVDWSSRLERRLLAGDRSGVMGVLESALAAGADPIDLYVDVVSPAMVSIGERWASSQIDVSTEHRASVVISQCLAVLSARFTRRGVRRGTVIVGAAPGERHSLPARLVADVVRLSGFEVEDLGADVPASSFAYAADAAENLLAVLISVSIADNLDAARAAVEAIRDASPVPIFVGGAALQDADVAATLGADQWAPDARAAVAALEELQT